MTNWKISTLGEICKNGGGSIQTGPFGSQLHESDYQQEGIPVIMPADINNGLISTRRIARVSESHVQRLKRHKLQFGDIVYGRRGDIGRQALVRDTNVGWLCGTGCLKVSLGSAVVSSEFLHRYLSTQSVIGWIEGQAVGATMPNLNTSILERVPVIFPEAIETQQKIAAILTAYDDLIANNQRRITLLERMAEDIYREWFVRLRFPGHENTTIEKGVPQGWSVHKFRDVVQFYIGGGWGEEVQTATHSEPAYVVRGTDIPGLNNGDAQISSLRFHTPSNLKSRLMQKGDLVFEVSGGSKDQLLGRNLLVSERLLRAHDNRVICASFCKMLRFNTALVSPHAMKYFFKLYYETDLVGLYQVQSTGISNYQFEAFLNYQTVLLPPLDLQARFDAMVEPMLELKDDIALQTVVLRKTRDALLPRLISGKLSVDALDIRFPPGMAANLDKKPVHQEQRV